MSNPRRSRLPLEEYDPEVPAMIEPSRHIKAKDVPEHCVICFFGEVVEKMRREHGAKLLSRRSWEDGRHPLYEISWQGTRLAFFQPGVGAPMAAGLLEETIALGCRKFIACGGAGNLRPQTPLGHLIIPTSAVRDEGTSFHYAAPTREITADPEVIAIISGVLRQKDRPFLTGKTWTTDAPYRETRAKVAARREEGCLTVDMEASAFMAVARFRGVRFGQILYSGDDLSGETWDDRRWSRSDVREELFGLAAMACLQL
jgi:uridine phosphorylase